MKFRGDAETGITLARGELLGAWRIVNEAISRARTTGCFSVSGNVVGGSIFGGIEDVNYLHTSRILRDSDTGNDTNYQRRSLNK